MFILTEHPHVSGHRSRIAVLDRLVAYIQSKPGVWFATIGSRPRLMSSKRLPPATRTALSCRTTSWLFNSVDF